MLLNRNRLSIVLHVLAIGFGLFGVGGLFFPVEIGNTFSLSGPSRLAFSLVAGAWFATAATCWICRHARLGGIYGKAVVVGQFAFFISTTPALVKMMPTPVPPLYVAITGLHVLGAIVFSRLMLGREISD